MILGETKMIIKPSYRLAIRTEGMIEDLVKNLRSENQELQMHCASAIFKVSTSYSTSESDWLYIGWQSTLKTLSIVFFLKKLEELKKTVNVSQHSHVGYFILFSRLVTLLYMYVT